MTWCPPAASHYLSKCRPRSISTYGVTRLQWVDELFYIFTTLFSKSFHTTVSSASIPFHSTTIFTLAYLLPLSLAHLPQQKKHHLNLLSSITKALLTHTLASFWRKQSCSKVHGASMGPTWGRQDPGGPHDSPVNLALWVVCETQPVLSSMYDYNQSIDKQACCTHNNHPIQSSPFTHIPWIITCTWIFHKSNKNAQILPKINVLDTIWTTDHIRN